MQCKTVPRDTTKPTTNPANKVSMFLIDALQLTRSSVTAVVSFHSFSLPGSLKQLASAKLVFPREPRAPFAFAEGHPVPDSPPCTRKPKLGLLVTSRTV